MKTDERLEVLEHKVDAIEQRLDGFFQVWTKMLGECALSTNSSYISAAAGAAVQEAEERGLLNGSG